MTITTTVITINNLFTALFPLVCMQASGEHVLGNECVTRALFVAGIFSFFHDWIPRSEVSWSHWAGCWERENPQRWCFKVPPGGEEFFGDALSSIMFFQAYYYCCCCCCCCCYCCCFACLERKTKKENNALFSNSFFHVLAKDTNFGQLQQKSKFVKHIFEKIKNHT